MTLDNLVVGRLQVPPRIVVYGVEGIGKSTFASEAPDPIFLGMEEGTAQLDVKRFPTPEDVSWTDVLDAIRELTTKQHDFKTLVIDTLDWVEPIIWAHICARDRQTGIEGYGYGKGYVAALDEWRLLLAAIERLRRTREMGVIAIAHSWVKPFRNPSGDDFERYEMKIHQKAAKLWMEWSDAVLFANHELLTIKDDRTKRVKGISSGTRLLYTTHSAWADAKNRFGLPETLPLSWAEFEAAVKAGVPSDPAAIVTAIAEMMTLGSDKLQADTRHYLEQAGADGRKLAQLLNWVTARVEREQREAGTTEANHAS